MDINLGPAETRVMGVLIEKQMATPEYYPLTLNALINACNQKTNRDPVMQLDEEGVIRALDRLRQERLVWQVRTHGSRAAKYEHAMADISDFSKRELVILAELMLRGPQTTGELRTRASRMVEFQSLRDVEYTLQKLMEREKGPFVVKLARQPGHKESRYAQTFSVIEETAGQGPEKEEERLASPEKDRLSVLEETVESLSDQLKELRADFEAFRKQFE